MSVLYLHVSYIYIYISIHGEDSQKQSSFSAGIFLRWPSKSAFLSHVLVCLGVHLLVWNVAIQKEIHTTTWRIGRKQKRPSPACRHDFSRRDSSRDSPFGSRVMLGVVRLVIFPQGIQKDYITCTTWDQKKDGEQVCNSYFSFVNNLAKGFTS